jgi:hypothetical protein
MNSLARGHEEGLKENTGRSQPRIIMPKSIFIQIDSHSIQDWIGLLPLFLKAAHFNRGLELLVSFEVSQ